jgi:hypothetical protein
MDQKHSQQTAAQDSRRRWVLKALGRLLIDDVFAAKENNCPISINSQPRVVPEDGHSIPKETYLEYGKLTYHSLDRPNGEIPLERVPPPCPKSTPISPLDFDPDIVRAELEYDSINCMKLATQNTRHTEVNTIPSSETMPCDLPDFRLEFDAQIFSILMHEHTR